MPDYLDDNGEIKKTYLDESGNTVSEPQESRGLLGHFLEAPKFVTDAAQKASDWITKPTLNDVSGLNPSLPYLKGFAGGAVQGAANLLSPANALMTALPESRLVNLAVGGAQGLEGINQIRKGNYWTGAGDIGFGLLGLHQGLTPHTELPVPKGNFDKVAEQIGKEEAPKWPIWPQMEGQPPELPKPNANKKWSITSPQYRASLEPIEAKTKTGGVKIGADVESLGRVLGSSLYSGDIAPIATKELMQNAIDATRHLNEKGEVHVTIDRSKNSISVRDNGRGLSLKELQTVFSDLGSSGKRGESEASGGFGLAKAAPLLGGKRVEVSTVNRADNGQLLKHEFSGTPEELLSGVDIKSTPTDESTGTTVRTYIPENSNYYSTGDMANRIARHSLGYNGKINLDRGYGLESRRPSTGLRDADITTLNSPSADIDIIIPKGVDYGRSYGLPYNIANNGMYQTTSRLGNKEIQGVPSYVNVNIKPKVPEGHSDYPFTANRESLRGSAQEVINQHLQDVIVNPAIGKRAEQLRQAYQGMIPMDIPTKGNRPFVLYDVGRRFTEDELKSISETPAIREMSTHIADAIHDSLARINNPDWSNNIERYGMFFHETPDVINKGLYLPNPGTDKATVLINPFSIMSRRDPELGAIGISHTIAHEMAHAMGEPHGEGHTQNLSMIYETIGDILHDAENKLIGATSSDEGRTYLPKIQEILSKYTESRGRPQTFEDPLYGTGTQSAISRPGETEIPSSAQPGEEGTARIKQKGLFETANDAAKNLAMSVGIPSSRTALGPHSWNILTRTLAVRPSMMGEVVKDMFSTARAGKVIDENIASGDFGRFMQAGMRFSSEEHEALKNPVVAEKGLTGVKAALDVASKYKANLFENPIFGRLVPAAKIELAKRVEKEVLLSVRDRALSQGASKEEAALAMTQYGDKATKTAAQFANNLFGGIDFSELGVSPGFHKVMKGIFFAPDFSVYSPYNLARGASRALMDPKNPANLPYRNMVRNLGVAAVLGNAVNFATSGHFMFQNDPRHILDIEVGRPNYGEKQFAIPFLSPLLGAGSVLPEAAAAVAMNRGDMIPDMIANRFSPLGKVGTSLGLNRGYGGRPIYGPDKYGRARDFTTQVLSTGRAAVEPVLPGQVESTYDLLKGQINPAQAATRFFGLPLRIYSPAQEPR